MEARAQTITGAAAAGSNSGARQSLPGSQRPNPAAAAAPVNPSKPKTVLVVDDNRDYRELVKHLLSVHHYNVLEAGNGQEALAVLARQMPDLILVDFNMPKMNGYEMIQEVRSNYETRKLKIIMFTGATNRQHLRSLNMDISDFLEKPVSNSKLLESVQKALGTVAAPKPAVPPRPAAPPPKPAAPAPAPEPETLEPEPPTLSIERFEQAAPQEHKEQPRVQVELPQEALQAEAAPQPVELPEQAPEPEQAPQEEALPVAAPQAAPEPEPVPEQEPELPDMDSMLGEDNAELEVLESGAPRKEDKQENVGLENLSHDSPLIQRVNKILMAAVEMRASDIHIEPFENKVLVRVRVDGVLRLLTTLPISIHPRLTARIKIMASLVITERRLPQDGQFRVQIRGNRIEFRVSTVPCIKGEKIVMRVLGQSKLNSSLSQLTLTPRELISVQGALKSSNGLILVTGPTGSGKTTTLYTMINVLNRPDVNIMTAEDPVEYEVPNVNQVKVLSSIGLTFESTLRAFLRQDPDVMLVGEIRDAETAEIAIKASITGHLVFSTLHTNSAPATVVRLTHMGVAPYLVAASVRLVVAQRLVRTLCQHCRGKGAVTAEDRQFLTKPEIESLSTIYHPVGCRHCSGGYSGRRAVFEVMPVETSAMRQLITTSNEVEKLSALAVSEGMTTLRQSALDAVRRGETSLQEAFKVMLG